MLCEKILNHHGKKNKRTKRLTSYFDNELWFYKIGNCTVVVDTASIVSRAGMTTANSANKREIGHFVAHLATTDTDEAFDERHNVFYKTKYFSKQYEK